MVQREAYSIWKSREQDRRRRNWYAAHSQFALALSGVDPIFSWDPRYEKIETLAEQIYQRAKAADALRDWLEAEKFIALHYMVAD